MVDLIKIIDQLKYFLANESDTFLGLTAFILAELAVISYLSQEIFSGSKEYIMWVIGITIAITIAIWAFRRHIYVPKQTISIALANLDVILLDIRHPLSSEERINLERELLNYLTDALYWYKVNLNFDKQITIINLPNRIKLNERTAAKYARKIKANILIWGTAKYDSKETVYIEPHFEFYKEPHGLFYKKVKEKLLSKDIFKINLNTALSDKKDSDLSTLLHYVIYIALFFDGVKALNHKQFEDAQSIFNKGIERIIQVKNPTPTLHDIFLVLQFYRAKNLHMWGNYLMKKNKKQEALEKYDLALKEFFKKTVKRKSADEKEFLKQSYLYGLHVMIKEGKLKQAEKTLDKLRKKYHDAPSFIEDEIEFLGKKHSKKLNALIKKIDKKSIKHKEKIYNQIGDFYYTNKQYKKAEEYYNKKLKITQHQIYNPLLFDVEDHLRLMHIYLKHARLLKAQKEWVRAMINTIKNKFVKEL